MPLNDSLGLVLYIVEPICITNLCGREVNQPVYSATHCYIYDCREEFGMYRSPHNLLIFCGV